MFKISFYNEKTIWQMTDLIYKIVEITRILGVLLKHAVNAPYLAHPNVNIWPPPPKKPLDLQIHLLTLRLYARYHWLIDVEKKKGTEISYLNFRRACTRTSVQRLITSECAKRKIWDWYLNNSEVFLTNDHRTE